MESNFDRFLRHPFSMTTQPMWPTFDFPKMDEIFPPVDIFEEKGDMVIKAEMPGMNKEDVNVSITENTVTISGEKKQEEEVEKKGYYRVERSYGSFCRKMSMATRSRPRSRVGSWRFVSPRPREENRKRLQSADRSQFCQQKRFRT